MFAWASVLLKRSDMIYLEMQTMNKNVRRNCMLSKEKLDRISELSQKSKKEALSSKEVQEQKELREEYLSVFRKSMRHHIEGMKVVDEEGTDVTPEKLKTIQKEKKLHGRHEQEEC